MANKTFNKAYRGVVKGSIRKTGNICPHCKGSGMTEGVWYGQPTGKIVKCQICNGTGRSNVSALF